MIKGQGNQVINAQILKAADGSAFAGVVSVYITGDSGAQVLGSVNGGVATAKGNGEYQYSPAAAETQYDLIAFTWVGAGAIPVTVNVPTIAPSTIAALQAANGLTSIGIPDLLLDAATEIQVVRAGGKLEPGVAAWMLRKLNRMLDRWNVTPGTRYVKQFASYVPTVNHNPHTIGPAVGADWATAGVGRPDRILRANLILNTVTPAVRIPIRVIDIEEWNAEPVRDLATSMPLKLYYEPDWPNGSVNLWPKPTTTFPIELLTDQTFSAFGPADTLYLPFGYQDAIVLSLAEESAPGLGQKASDDLKGAAMDARVVTFGANNETRRVRTRDAGMPGGRGGRYLYRTGRIHSK